MKLNIYIGTSALSLCFLLLRSEAVAQDVTQFQQQQPNGVTRYTQPILSPDKAKGDGQVFNPTVVQMGNKLAMIYRRNGSGPATGSQCQLAFSEDGRTFVPYAGNPVLMPSMQYDHYGCEDPRVVRFDGIYYLTYCGNWGKGYIAQCLATSTDLIHWEKKGVVLQPPTWGPKQCKAAVIVPEKINGRYVMYFIGEKIAWQPSIGMATSIDLIHWTALDHSSMSARPNHFDSLGVECGATPIVLPEGILLIYNGWNPAHVHKTGWVLFSKDDPSKVLKRCEVPVIEPQFPYEIDGRHVFTFTEGAVFFKGLWRFYYGAADKWIGLGEIDDIEKLLNAKP
jgi:predicted GH43/DUF377 family glycosyl hydrolase